MPNYIGYEPSFGTPPRDKFTGNGSIKVFTLSKTPGSTDNILVTVSGVVQDSGTYSVSGNTLTFQDSPPAPVTGQLSTNVEVTYLGRQPVSYLNNRSGLASNGIYSFTATGPILAAYVNALILINAAGATTMTLPAANSVPPGGTFEILNINSGTSTVQRAGTDNIQPNATTITSVVLGPGDSVVLRSDGSSVWYLTDGTSAAQYSTAFAGLKSANGYTRTGSGVLIQWGTGTANASGVLAVTYPIAFPTAVTSVMANGVSTGAASNIVCSYQTPTTTTVTINVATNAGAASATAAYWMAIGY